jgi:hypothetical protein
VSAWIACSERMPAILDDDEHDGCSEWVLVFAPDRGASIALWEVERWVWDSAGYAIPSEVTHWMPLPEPPKEAT